MRIQDSIIEATRHAANEFFRYAKAVPADKLEWKPLDEGRSVLDICKEVVQCSVWSTDILSGKSMPDFDEASMEEYNKITASWTTVEICEEVGRKNLEAFYEAIASFPDEKLDDKYTLPFDGGQVITMKENMQYPLWNIQYHQGQVAYIQTLYGDKKMYW